VWFAWNANTVIRQNYDHTDEALAVEWVEEWRSSIVVWHRSHVSK
jgi:hypothetical protein